MPMAPSVEWAVIFIITQYIHFFQTVPGCENQEDQKIKLYANIMR